MCLGQGARCVQFQAKQATACTNMIMSHNNRRVFQHIKCRLAVISCWLHICCIGSSRMQTQRQGAADLQTSKCWKHSLMICKPSTPAAGHAPLRVWFVNCRQDLELAELCECL